MTSIVPSLVQTEKTYNLSQQNVFVLSFPSAVAPNKIQLAQILLANGLHPIKINVVNLPAKVKVRGAKRRIKLQKRPVKFYVKLQPGEVLDGKKLTEIFTKNQLV